MNATVRQGAREELWRELVKDAEDRAGRALDEWRESYLVFVLLRHQEDSALLGRTQALDWLSAQEQVGTSRADALRDVGDRCLLIAGLFPGLAERRRVSVDYYIGLGRGAYDEVARCTRAGYAELFDGLARAYPDMVRVLRVLDPRRATGTLRPDIVFRH